MGKFYKYKYDKRIPSSQHISLSRDFDEKTIQDKKVKVALDMTFLLHCCTILYKLIVYFNFLYYLNEFISLYLISTKKRLKLP